MIKSIDKKLPLLCDMCPGFWVYIIDREVGGAFSIKIY